MMLSFSIPEMRVLIEAGLRERALTGFPAPLPPKGSGAQRVKRQTIRRRGPLWQRMIAEAAGGRVERDLHLWWRSRSKERALLGVVRGFEIWPVTIEHRGGECAIHTAMASGYAPASGTLHAASPAFEAIYAHRMAHDDGFGDFAAFVRFFVPRAGDRFAGALIRW